MKKHLIPDRSDLPRLPYRLLKENWWLEEDVNFGTHNISPFKRRDDAENLRTSPKEVRTCN